MIRSKYSIVGIILLQLFIYYWLNYNLNQTDQPLILGTVNMSESSSAGASGGGGGEFKVDKEALKARLSEIQYRVTQEKDTELPFSGEYLKLKDNGMYSCLVCGTDLFPSGTKYDSGCGWPAFYDAIKTAVKLTPDNSLGMKRTEVTCAKCDSHLGHVFEDGPKPTGIRYCINSASLKFNKQPKN